MQQQGLSYPRFLQQGLNVAHAQYATGHAVREEGL